MYLKQWINWFCQKLCNIQKQHSESPFACMSVYSKHYPGRENEDGDFVFAWNICRLVQAIRHWKPTKSVRECGYRAPPTAKFLVHCVRTATTYNDNSFHVCLRVSRLCLYKNEGNRRPDIIEHQSFLLIFSFLKIKIVRE